MPYHNLDGDVKNGAQAMAAIALSKHMTPEELAKLQQDLQVYCGLDTMAVVKILKKLYEVAK